VHDRFVDGIEMNFNYCSLMTVAAVIAALGLVSNSSATIIASMLVSPLMGPVVGLGYGTCIHDWQMVRHSFRSECLSLVFCVVVGGIVGAITGPTSLSDSWPTQEMYVRGTLTNFLVALPVAFFSGLGVAVSLLDDQTASLVGVAISASLLPPAVNAGVLWVAYAFTKTDELSLYNNESPTTARDYRNMGFYSLFLTLANIILIWMSSMLMFRLKEVLPIKKKIFWSDLNIARKIYQRKAVMIVPSNFLEEETGAERTTASDGNV
jgi:uncharacterized hydrophobic protein (TIGR00271 family)